MAKNVYTQEMMDLVTDMYEDHTYREISKALKEILNVTVSHVTLRKVYQRYLRGDLVVHTKEEAKKIEEGPKILLLDIETAPIEGYVWGMWDNNLGLNQIKQDWTIMAWAAKWLGDPPSKIMYEDVSKNKNMRDDKAIVKKLRDLLDASEIIIGQNSRRFDIKKIQARIAMHKIDPPSPFRQIDTLNIAKRHFAFTSNKLAYLTDKLNIKFKKLDHAKFHGFSLWQQCLNGNKKAWKEMKEYNLYDVLSLEELYNYLVRWDTSINFSVYHEDNTCSCGSKQFVKKGFHFTNAGKYQRYACKVCGKYTRGKENLLSKEKRKSLTSNVTR